MDKNTLGQRLKDRRTAKGLTLQELSALTGVHASYLGRIEASKRQPSAPILRRLAEPLGFTEAELLKLAGYLSPDEVDDRIARWKQSMKCEITVAMASLLEKVDTL